MKSEQIAEIIRRADPDPRLQTLTDQEIVNAALKLALNNHAPMLQFLNATGLGEGLLSVMYEGVRSKKVAEILAQRLAAAKSVHEILNLHDATSRGVTREVLPQIQLLEHETVEFNKRTSHNTDEALRLKRGESDIELDHDARDAGLSLKIHRESDRSDFEILKSHRHELSEMYKELDRLEKSDAPSKERQIKVLQASIAALEKDYYARAGQESVPGKDGGDLGRMDNPPSKPQGPSGKASSRFRKS